MNVTVENLAPCKKLLRVEVDSQEVDKEFESMISNYQKQASLPGFRPGKAPRQMVVKRYEKDIHDEVKKKLIPEAYRKAVDEQKLDVVGSPDLEEIQFGQGKPLQFAVTLETAPDFELPEYKGINVKRETTQVTDEDVEKAFTALREQKSEYKTVDRVIQAGDVAVVNYTGTTDGKPLTDLAPAARGLTSQQAFWINVEEKSFIPGFAMQLIGAKAGEKRTVNVDFPADFVTPQLAGLKGVYEVDITEVKEKAMPALDDEFAKGFGAENLEKMREGVRADLSNELEFKKKRSIRSQLIDELIKRVNFELPESEVARETRNVVYNIVNENQKRGVSKELIEQEKDAIYSAASDSAKTRLKVNFLLRKIAEKEDVKVSQEEVASRIYQLAGMYQIEPEQFLADLRKRNGVMEIYDQVAQDKILTILQEHAKIEDVAPEAPAPQAPANPAV